MKKFWITCFFFINCFIEKPAEAVLNVEVKSESAILINAENGKVLFSKNASKLMYPASCTKVAFALYTIQFHQALFNNTVICTQNSLKALPESKKSLNNYSSHPSYILETDASHMGLKVGEKMLFSELLEATMVVSADDASNILAEIMGGGSIDKCVQDVNDYLITIGCKNTHFTNPHGLHHPAHLTTAEDLAIMCREAMKEPLFAKIAQLNRFQRPKTNKQESVLLLSTNKMLSKTSPHYYSAMKGIKTGYHRRAGHCLTAYAEKNGRQLISVVLNGKTKIDRYDDTKKLFEAGFQEPKVKREFLSAGPKDFQKRLDSADSPLTTETNEALVYSYYPSEEPVVKCQLIWNTQIEIPLKKGTVVGELHLIADGEIKHQVQLLAANDVNLSLKAHLDQYFIYLLLAVAVVLIFVALFILLCKKR